jgi:hypothetical protein
MLLCRARNGMDGRCHEGPASPIVDDRRCDVFENTKSPLHADPQALETVAITPSGGERQGLGSRPHSAAHAPK